MKEGPCWAGSGSGMEAEAADRADPREVGPRGEDHTKALCPCPSEIVPPGMVHRAGGQGGEKILPRKLTPV